MMNGADWSELEINRPLARYHQSAVAYNLHNIILDVLFGEMQRECDKTVFFEKSLLDVVAHTHAFGFEHHAFVQSIMLGNTLNLIKERCMFGLLEYVVDLDRSDEYEGEKHPLSLEIRYRADDYMRSDNEPSKSFELIQRDLDRDPQE